MATMFVKYYGGHIATAVAALQLLVHNKDRFSPFDVLALDELQMCIDDPQASSWDFAD